MIHVIIPVFNRLHYTINCISSLKQQNFRDFRIIVVDDGSTDGTYSHIRNNFPDVEVLRGDGNLWWTGATNLAVDHILEKNVPDDDFILTLNNDLIVKPDYFEKLLEVYNDNKPCLVGSISVDINNPEFVEYCGLRWNKYTALYKPNAKPSDTLSKLQETTKAIPSDLLWGRGVLIPVPVIKKIGMFDQKEFPHYMADEDFSARANKAGYKSFISTFAVVYNHIQLTGLNGVHKKKGFSYWKDMFFSKKSGINLANRFKWAKKHGRIPALYFAFDISRIVFSELKKIVLHTS